MSFKMPRPYLRLRETTFDLYVERDLLPGYHKVVSVSSSWLVLAGYILFALIFSTRDEDLNTTRTLVTAIASTLLIVGYVGIVAMALLNKSLLFLIDAVIGPTLTASLLGLFTTVANFALHTRLQTSQVYMSVPLVTSCVTTVVSGITMAIAYRELRKIRRRDERRRWHASMGGPYIGHAPPVIRAPDDEAQRRQLMRLLHDRQEGIANTEEIQNTFKIDLPGAPKNETRRSSSTDERGRSPGRGFNIGQLMPWRKTSPGTFKDARERRREEIERSSLPPFGDAYTPQTPNGIQQPQSPAWGWPPATRYA